MRTFFIGGLALLFVGCGITGIEEREDDAIFENMAFTVDGEVAPVVPELTLAYLDSTVDAAGPHTEYYVRLQAMTDSRADSLVINIPKGVGVGTHPVHFTPLPGESHIWIKYQEATYFQGGIFPTTTMHAYAGQVRVEILEERVGGRLRLTFESLKMGSVLGRKCGESMLLEDGVIEVTLGNEDARESQTIAEEMGAGDTDLIDGWNWELNENSAALEFADGTVVLCKGAQYYFETRTSVDGESWGEDIDVFDMLSFCDCYRNTLDEEPAVQMAFWASVPMPETGLMLNTDSNHRLLVLEDHMGTYAQSRETYSLLRDDYLYSVNDETTSPGFYHAAGQEVGSFVWLESTGPVYMDQILGPDPLQDPQGAELAPHRQVNYYSGRGKIQRDCRPLGCN